MNAMAPETPHPYILIDVDKLFSCMHVLQKQPFHPVTTCGLTSGLNQEQGSDSSSWCLPPHPTTGIGLLPLAPSRCSSPVRTTIPRLGESNDGQEHDYYRYRPWCRSNRIPDRRRCLRWILQAKSSSIQRLASGVPGVWPLRFER